MLARLERIDELERRLLVEVEALGREAERWACQERDAGAARAAENLLARFREP